MASADCTVSPWGSGRQARKSMALFAHGPFRPSFHTRTLWLLPGKTSHKTQATKTCSHPLLQWIPSQIEVAPFFPSAPSLFFCESASLFSRACARPTRSRSRANAASMGRRGLDDAEEGSRRRQKSTRSAWVDTLFEHAKKVFPKAAAAGIAECKADATAHERQFAHSGGT